MNDLFKSILKAVASQAGMGDGQAGKIERELSKKFDALENRTRRDGAKRWLFLVFVCALLGVAAFFGYREMKKEVQGMIAERLDREFSSAYLQRTIEDSAKKYAELNLKDYVDGELAAHYRVGKLEAMARADSRRAYEELAALAGDARFKEEAEFSLSVVQKRYASLVYPFEPPGTLEAQEGSSVQMKLDPSAPSDAQIAALRPRLSQLAQESQKNYLVPDFIRFLKESDSLGASVGICRILAHNYGPQAGDYEFDKWARHLEALDKDAVKISGLSK